MNEKKKHKIMLGIEVVFFCMIVAILGTNAASSNPPSNGVSYSKNNQTTVEGALNDLYTKANYGNASASQILKDKTALVGGSKVTGTMPSKNGSSQASKVSTNANNVYMVFPYGYYPAENHFNTANTSEVYATNADVASAIGLTAGKLLKGQTVLGITGTGETSCPTCESQGYWKVYEFEDLEATCSRKSGECKPNSWFSASSVTTKSCGKECLEYTSENDTYLTADIELNYKEILGINVDIKCISTACIRESTQKSEAGGADKTTSARYFSAGYGYGFRVGLNGYVIRGTGENYNVHMIHNYLNSSKLEVTFSSGTDLVTSVNSPIELKGTSYKLSGYIIYR
jgi:hypothetical protein